MQNYETTEYNYDTYKSFIELGIKLLKNNGYCGYITPNTWFVLEKGATKLRHFLFDHYTLLNIVEMFNVFPDAVVEPTITIIQKQEPLLNRNIEVISVPRKTELLSTFINDGVYTCFQQKDLRTKENYLFNFRKGSVAKFVENDNK